MEEQQKHGQPAASTAHLPFHRVQVRFKDENGFCSTALNLWPSTVYVISPPVTNRLHRWPTPYLLFTLRRSISTLPMLPRCHDRVFPTAAEKVKRRTPSFSAQIDNPPATHRIRNELLSTVGGCKRGSCYQLNTAA